MPRIDGSKVLITGASSGIGAEIARQLAARGCHLALMARRLDRLQELKDQLGDKVHIYTCDVAEKSQVMEAFEQADKDLDGLDVVILNAGVGRPTPTSRFRSEDMEWIFKINVFGLFYGVEAVLPKFIERKKGVIVGISSLAGYRGLPISSAYGGSKAAVTNMLEGMRVELKSKGVDVVVVSPGFVKSELTDKNKHPMPFMWPTDRAARKIIRGIEKRSREVHFPFPLFATLALAKMFPNFLWDFLASSLSPKKDPNRKPAS